MISTMHTHAHKRSQHNILAINIKSKKTRNLFCSYAYVSKMMSYIIFLLSERLYLIKVNQGSYIIYQGIQKTDGNKQI